MSLLVDLLSKLFETQRYIVDICSSSVYMTSCEKTGRGIYLIFFCAKLNEEYYFSSSALRDNHNGNSRIYERMKNKIFASFYCEIPGDLYCRVRCGYLIKLGGLVVVESCDEAGDTEGTTPVRLRVPLLQRSYVPEE
jgi:hypothetical protein